MAINYTWSVNNCDVFSAKSGKSNVVHQVHWRLRATDDSNNDADGNPQTVEIWGKQRLDTSDLSSFTNWSSLDAAKVQGWVETALGTDKVAELKSDLDARIATKIESKIIKKQLTS
tara:strand:- start:795 stop:1142 length:348 start_codon:yes stop_codon:yes gene_type:complete